MSYVIDAQAQRMRALELGMYCLKFGLTKADLEEVLHIKRIKELVLRQEKGLIK